MCLVLLRVKPAQPGLRALRGQPALSQPCRAQLAQLALQGRPRPFLAQPALLAQPGPRLLSLAQPGLLARQALKGQVSRYLGPWQAPATCLLLDRLGMVMLLPATCMSGTVLRGLMLGQLKARPVLLDLLDLLDRLGLPVLREYKASRDRLAPQER